VYIPLHGRKKRAMKEQFKKRQSSPAQELCRSAAHFTPLLFEKARTCYERCTAFLGIDSDPIDHHSRSERLLWGNTLVAGLGSQSRFFVLYRQLENFRNSTFRVPARSPTVGAKLVAGLGSPFLQIPLVLLIQPWRSDFHSFHQKTPVISTISSNFHSPWNGNVDFPSAVNFLAALRNCHQLTKTRIY
jgi:hypothetical protein